MLITLIALLVIAAELHLLFSNKRTNHIYSIESVVKIHNPPYFCADNIYCLKNAQPAL